MSIFIPVLYICMNGHCEFLQQLSHYTDRAQCMAIVEVKKQEFVKENSYKQFFPADVQSKLNKLNETSRIYFVLANLFSSPVYILFFII